MCVGVCNLSTRYVRILCLSAGAIVFNFLSRKMAQIVWCNLFSADISKISIRIRMWIYNYLNILDYIHDELVLVLEALCDIVVQCFFDLY